MPETGVSFYRDGVVVYEVNLIPSSAYKNMKTITSNKKDPKPFP